MHPSKSRLAVGLGTTAGEQLHGGAQRVHELLEIMGNMESDFLLLRKEPSFPSRSHKETYCYPALYAYYIIILHGIVYILYYMALYNFLLAFCLTHHDKGGNLSIVSVPEQK